MLRVTEPYHPNDNVQTTIKECVDAIVSKDEKFDDWRQINLQKNPMLKFKVLAAIFQVLKETDLIVVNNVRKTFETCRCNNRLVCRTQSQTA
jgi:hypothetical protein